MIDSENILINVVGPTAIGKTELAIALARQFNTDILSADSRQFYREMRIGTAVPSDQELAQVPHHFIQHKRIFDTYSVGDFERDALNRLSQLFMRHRVVVMVGGSGLYTEAVIKGLDHFPEVDPAIRKKLVRRFETEGIQDLQKELAEKDPEYYERVDHENPRRVMRALEVCIQSGKPYSSFLDRPKPKRPFRTITVGLDADRKTVYDRIEKRVDRMMEAGLLEEARSLYKYQHLNALQTVGYRELFDHFDGKVALSAAVEAIKTNTRRFAKRQFTWFKKDASTLWFDYNTPHPTIGKVIMEEMEKNHG